MNKPPTAVTNKLLARVGAVQPDEARALLWSFAYFFCLLAGYCVLRPVRDEMGLASGIKNLPKLFTITFLVMLAVMPTCGVLVARLSRRVFILAIYHGSPAGAIECRSVTNSV